METTPTFAKHETYGGGGYVADLKSSRENSELFLKHWKANNWIDSKTRAIIVEMNTFNPPTGLFSATAIVFEKLPSGVFYPFVQILTSKLYYYTTNLELMAIPFEINFIIMTIIMTIRELWKGCKKGAKKYCLDPWNLNEMLIIALSYVAIVLYMKRTFLIGHTLRNYKKGKCRNVFTNFYPALLADFTQVGCQNIKGGKTKLFSKF